MNFIVDFKILPSLKTISEKRTYTFTRRSARVNVQCLSIGDSDYYYVERLKSQRQRAKI